MNTQTMKALIYEGPKMMNMRKIPIPRLEEGEVLIKVHRVGICGSELGGYLGHNSLRKPPLVMGHEFSGVIADICGDVEHLLPGDKVTVNPLISCMRCSDCQSGTPQLCANRSLLGAHQSGAFAEFVKVPANNTYRLPAHVSMDTGALTEPFACGVHVCSIGQFQPTDRLLIVGAGPIGLFVLIAAQLIGIKDIVVMDINKERLDIAKKLGALTASTNEELYASRSGLSFDCAVDAVGMEITRKQCVESIRPGGKIVLSGLHESHSGLPINNMIRNEAAVYGAFAYTPQDFEKALQWLIEDRIDLSPWIEYLPLEEGRTGFETLINDPGKIAKILLKVS